MAAGELLRQFKVPKGTPDHEYQLAMFTQVFGGYGDDVIKAAVSVQSGIAARLKWMPTMAELHEFLRAEQGRADRHAEYRGRIATQLRARAEWEAERRRDRGNLVAAYLAMRKTETGPKDTREYQKHLAAVDRAGRLMFNRESLMDSHAYDACSPDLRAIIEEQNRRRAEIPSSDEP